MLTKTILDIVVLSFNAGENSFNQLQVTLISEVDKKIMVAESNSFNIGFKIIVTCCIHYAVAIFSYLFFCLRLLMDCDDIEMSLEVFMKCSSFTVLIINSFSFHSVYMRMNLFLELVKNIDGGSIMDCLKIYKAIGDAVDRAKKPIYLLVSIKHVLIKTIK